MWATESHGREGFSPRGFPGCFPVRLLRRLLGDEKAATAVEFAFVFPLLLGLSFGILDFTLLAFDYHRAGEATRRAARTASIVAPVADLSSLAAGGPVVCTSGGGGVTCSGAAVADAASFTAVVDDMQTIYPDIASDNVSITYSFTGLGDATTPGGIIPMVTVDLVNFSHNFLMLSALPGMPDGTTLPALSTSYLAASYSP